MEHKSSSATAIVALPAYQNQNKILIKATDNDPHHVLPKKKKKRGAMHVIRVALYMLTHKSRKPKSVVAYGAGEWKKVVGSMRPLHAQSNEPPPQLVESVPEKEKVVDEQSDVMTPPWSPAYESTTSSSGDHPPSQYASADNLQELDESDEEEKEDDDGGGDKDGGDEMIDIKAEQFIAQFYQQMRLQHQVYNTRMGVRYG